MTSTIEIFNIKNKFKIHAPHIKLKSSKGVFKNDTKTNEVFYMSKNECKTYVSLLIWNFMAYGAKIMFFHGDNYFHFQDPSTITKNNIDAIINSKYEDIICANCNKNVKQAPMCIKCNISYCKKCSLMPCVKCKNIVGYV